MDTNTELYSKRSVSLAPISKNLNVIPDSKIIPISWWWITNGCPVFRATEDGLILASGYNSINDTRIIEGQSQNEVRFPMFKTELLREGIEKSEAWCDVERRMKVLVVYAAKLDMLEGLRFYGWFQRHMGDMGLGCSNIILEPTNQFCFELSNFVEKLPKSFNCSTGKWSVPNLSTVL